MFVVLVLSAVETISSWWGEGMASGNTGASLVATLSGSSLSQEGSWQGGKNRGSRHGGKIVCSTVTSEPCCSHSEAEELGPTGGDFPHASVPSCCCGGAVEVGGVISESQASSRTWGLPEDGLKVFVSVSADARARSLGTLPLLLRL